jgi:hypothetical protein
MLRLAGQYLRQGLCHARAFVDTAARVALRRAARAAALFLWTKFRPGRRGAFSHGVRPAI